MSDETATDPITIDQLTGQWTIAQRKKGHRHSTDDLMTGWFALQVTDPYRILDLGAGIGGVGLIALWRSSPQTTLVAIEAQEVSYRLLVDNVARNGLTGKVTTIHGDIRDVRLQPQFDLVTGSPPYWDVSEGVVPEDSQKAHARFELRGDVRDYCLAARAHLVPRGTFVFCFPTVQRKRAEAAIVAADLRLSSARDVIPRAGSQPLFTLFACGRVEDGPFAGVQDPPHIVRDEHGEPTLQHLMVRESLGFPMKR